MSDRDQAFMDRALSLAERGLGRTSPNPIVGAVVVSPDGIIVGQGAHLRAGGPHAEVVALERAGERSRGATLYCTLEPCSHLGRTGPCVERIVAAGIHRVVAATADVNPRVAGKGFEFLRSHGVEVATGVGRGEALRQHAPFFTWVTKGRPFVIAKTAVSADGFVARVGERVQLTGPAADRFFQRQRAAVDAIAVGSETVLVDDPLLTARGVYRFQPLARVLFDWRGRVGAGARVFSTLDAGPVIMAVLASTLARRDAPARTLSRRGIEIERCETMALEPVLERLAARGIVTLLLEGGPMLQRAFARAGLVDRIQVVTTPRELGSGVRASLPELTQGRADRVVRLGEDTLVETDVHGSDRSDRAH